MMISKISANSQLQNLVVSTGNVLNAYNKLARKSSEELLDGLKLALESSDQSTTTYIELNEKIAEIQHATQELSEKISENQRDDLSVGAKLFVNKNSSECIEQAVRALLQTLHVQHVDNVVLAYHPKATAEQNGPVTPSVNLEGGFKWSGSGSSACATELQELWAALEKHALQKEILQLGVCDLDGQTLADLYGAACVKPTIAQINLASCCVVPASLQDFCTQHDIQLLTHGDPAILLAPDQFVIPGFNVDWTLRYQVHVRCRGVISAKGYILGASRAASV